MSSNLNEETLNQYRHPILPASFRILGIGMATKEIIETVKSYKYDCVDASVIINPFECIPADRDKIAIIVAKDNESHANSIAKAFHDAGVLTIGLLYDADLDCYDSVFSEASHTDFPAIINEILQPIVSTGMICYGFNDLNTSLADTKHFIIKSAHGNGKGRLRKALDIIKRALTPSYLDTIEHISIFLYFNKKSNQPLMIQEIAVLTDIISELPESIDVIWAVYPDDNIKDDEIKVSIIAAGKELGNG